MSVELATRVDAEERALTLTYFGDDDAWWLGCRLRELGLARRAPLGIVVQRAAATLFGCLLPGASQDNLEWIRRKIALTLRMERSSYAIGLAFRDDPGVFERSGLSLDDYVADGGAVPIRVAGTGVIGAVGVSGLPQEIDHALAVQALGELKAHHDQAR